ncbi:hypothetical protein [Nostoc edaphicum]|nr:hypothetical protein [Nostoc edaphicum]
MTFSFNTFQLKAKNPAREVMADTKICDGPTMSQSPNGNEE